MTNECLDVSLGDHVGLHALSGVKRAQHGRQAGMAHYHMSAQQDFQARQLRRPRHARRCERVCHGRQHDVLLVQGYTRR
eukprot:503694-Prymnesium_polylepis.1